MAHLSLDQLKHRAGRFLLACFRNRQRNKIWRACGLTLQKDRVQPVSTRRGEVMKL